jgi:hypothetical protein
MLRSVLTILLVLILFLSYHLTRIARREVAEEMKKYSPVLCLVVLALLSVIVGGGKPSKEHHPDRDYLRQVHHRRIEHGQQRREHDPRPSQRTSRAVEQSREHRPQARIVSVERRSG